MEKILISACLIGDNTRYDGGNNYLPIVEKLKEKYDLIPFCPEVMGGLNIPRDPCEIKGLEIVTKDGVSKTKEYNLGAKKALQACKLFGIRIAILMESSPSCGVRNIHDGHFNKTKIPGKGITTRLLEENGIACYSSFDDLSFLIEEPQKKEKEYISYEEREEELRNRKKKSFNGRPSRNFGKKTEEKTKEVSNDSAEKKEFKKSFRSSPRQSDNFHRFNKERNFSHKASESKDKKPYFKKSDSFNDAKKDFKKDFSSEGKKTYHKKKVSFHKGGDKKRSFSKGPYKGRKSFGEKGKRFGRKSSFRHSKKD